MSLSISLTLLLAIGGLLFVLVPASARLWNLGAAHPRRAGQICAALILLGSVAYSGHQAVLQWRAWYRPLALLHRPTPAYPPLARDARIQGKVRFDAGIAPDGTVDTLRLIDGHPLLAAAARDAARRHRYVAPGTTVRTVIEIDFRLPAR